MQREKRAQKAKTPISIKAVNERVGNVGLLVSKKVSLNGNVTNGRINIERVGSNVQMENSSCDFYEFSGCLRSISEKPTIKPLFKRKYSRK